MLACQPFPAGDRIAIVSNAGGAGVLAADSCGDHGLRVAVLSNATQRRLSKLLPPGATVAGPVDTTAAVGQAAFRVCLEQVAADDGVDALLVVAVPTAIADLTHAIGAAQVTKPLAAAVLDQPETVCLIRCSDQETLPRGAGATAACEGTPDAGGPSRGDALRPAGMWAVPAYAYPEGAARALRHAVTYRAWRGRRRGQVPELSGLRTADARALVAGFLSRRPEGGWLPPAEVGDLLACYRIDLAAARNAAGGEAGVPATGGVEVLIGVVQEPVFGPVVVFGLGGVATEVLGDRAARLTPLTDTDAEDLIHAVHAAPLLFGHGGTPPVDTAALTGMLLRVSRLADGLHEVAELDLNPVIVTQDGAHAVAARIRVEPAQPRDPFLRRLR